MDATEATTRIVEAIIANRGFSLTDGAGDALTMAESAGTTVGAMYKAIFAAVITPNE